ncbi:MAG: hypothetical protein HQK84_08845 [Nitrospinae bacterium]|nr:hypothetical protein [Nitrospinota bacterium]
MISKSIIKASQKPVSEIIKSTFIDSLYKKYDIHVLEKKHTEQILLLQKKLSNNGSLKQNKRDEILESISNGLWIGVFEEQTIVAYTAFDFQEIEGKILLYFKVTAKNRDDFSGFQTKTFKLREKIGKLLLKQAGLPYIGGYCTVHPENKRCEMNIKAAGLKKLFQVKGCYEPSPKGDRNIYGCGNIAELRKLLESRYMKHLSPLGVK